MKVDLRYFGEFSRIFVFDCDQDFEVHDLLFAKKKSEGVLYENRSYTFEVTGSQAEKLLRAVQYFSRLLKNGKTKGTVRQYPLKGAVLRGEMWQLPVVIETVASSHKSKLNDFVTMDGKPLLVVMCSTTELLTRCVEKFWYPFNLV